MMKAISLSDSNSQSIEIHNSRPHLDSQRIPHVVQTVLEHLSDAISPHFTQSINLFWQSHSLTNPSSKRLMRFSKWMIVAALISCVNADLTISGNGRYFLTAGTNASLTNPPFSVAGASSSTVTFSCLISVLTNNFHCTFSAPSLTNTSATDWNLYGTQDVINTGFKSLVVNCPITYNALFQINCGESVLIYFTHYASMNFTIVAYPPPPPPLSPFPPTFTTPLMTTTPLTTIPPQTSLPRTFTSSLTQTMLSATTPITTVAQTILASSSFLSAIGGTPALTQTPSIFTQNVSAVLYAPVYTPHGSGLNILDWSLIAVAGVALACSILAFAAYLKLRSKRNSDEIKKIKIQSEPAPLTNQNQSKHTKSHVPEKQSNSSAILKYCQLTPEQRQTQTVRHKSEIADLENGHYTDPKKQIRELERNPPKPSYIGINELEVPSSGNHQNPDLKNGRYSNPTEHVSELERNPPNSSYIGVDKLEGPSAGNLQSPQFI